MLVCLSGRTFGIVVISVTFSHASTYVLISKSNFISITVQFISMRQVKVQIVKYFCHFAKYQNSLRLHYCNFSFDLQHLLNMC